MQQLQDDVLDVLADIASLGQRRRVRHGERHVKGLGQRLSEQGLAATGRADQQDVGFGQLDIASLAAMLQPLVVIVHGDREHTLGALLADHIIAENIANLLRRGHATFLATDERTLGLLADDVVAQFHAFIADEHGWAGDELANLMLGLPAEGAVEGALRIRSCELGHSISSLVWRTDAPIARMLFLTDILDRLLATPQVPKMSPNSVNLKLPGKSPYSGKDG